MRRTALACCLLAAVLGCARDRTPKPSIPAPDRIMVAVLPFQTGGALDEHGVFKPGATPDAVPQDAGLLDAGALAARLVSVRLIGVGVPAVAPDRVLALTPPPGAAVYDPRLAVRIARKAGATLAVLGAVTRYVEREGSALGVRTPASVAYQAALVRVPDGAIVTIDRFDYTQQPLTANLLDLPRFVRAGGRWMTREEILEGALGETAERFATALRPAPAR